MKKVLLLLAISIASTLQAQEKTERAALKSELKKEIIEALSKKEKSASTLFNRFELKGYGVLNYYNYTWDTDTEKRNAVDAERLNFYLNYKFNDRFTLKTELEIEHGGTGVTKELDKLEEFGEFETEVEAGGEVKLEQVYIDIAYKKFLNFKLGKFKMYFGLAQNLDTPDEYFTTHRPEMENELLPLGWYETGIEINGKFLNDKLQYRVAFVNGLDATGFSSRGFIKRGHQTRFEMANANNWAVATRLDYSLGKHKNSFIGFSTYFGNTADNRPKPDLKNDAYLFLAEGHITYNEGPLRFNSMFLYGNLQNSDLITLRNKNLSNALGVKRTPVAKNALGFSAEIGYDILTLKQGVSEQKIYPFVRYDFYDSMYKTHASITDNPRWERSTITGGINWFIHKGIIFKAQYANRTLGSKKLDANGVLTNNNEKENTFSAGVGFVF
jgi:hypothetical protein